MKGGSVKDQTTLQWLKRATPFTPGTYVCTVPGCKTKEKQDGFCPTHNVPLRLVNPTAL